DLETRGLRGDRVLERTALHPREDGTIDRLLVFLGAEDEAGPRTRERLVRRRGDEVAVPDRIRMQSRGDETGEVRHVAEQQRADVVRDLAEPRGVNGAWIRGAAADDQPRLRFARDPQHLVVVDD